MPSAASTVATNVSLVRKRFIAMQDVNVVSILRDPGSKVGLGGPVFPKGAQLMVLEDPSQAATAVACLPLGYWGLFPQLVGWKHLWRVLFGARYHVMVPVAALETAFAPRRVGV